MKIVPYPQVASHKTGSLPSTITTKQIEETLGFPANVKDDADKVKHSWGFKVDGPDCGIWDYKLSRWSVYDPDGKLPALFSKFN